MRCPRRTTGHGSFVTLSPDVRRAVGPYEPGCPELERLIRVWGLPIDGRRSQLVRSCLGGLTVRWTPPPTDHPKFGQLLRPRRLSRGPEDAALEVSDTP